MSTQGTFEGQGGTLTGRAPAARIFALVILSLVVLLGSLLAVRAIGQHDGNTPVSARPSADTPTDANGVLLVPKAEPKPKPKPEPKAERKPEPKKSTPTTSATPTQSSAASSSAASSSSSTPAPTPTPTPVQSAPAPTPTPAPTPEPSAPTQKKAPVQHTVVVTQ